MKYVCVALILFFASNLSALTTSVIVPCSYKHVQYLPELLQNIAGQTEQPEEVVISISEVDQADPFLIASIESTIYPFILKVLKNQNKLFAGQNRNAACRQALGEIFITQDADDLMHPQRIEIIKYFFSHYDIVHLIHRWVPELAPCNYEKSQIPFFFFKNYAKINRFTYVANGPIAIKRHVFDKIRWPDLYQAEDVDFNKKVCETFGKSMLIDAFIYIYRNQYSSFR